MITFRKIVGASSFAIQALSSNGMRLGSIMGKNLDGGIYLDSLMVRKKHRRRGLATALMTKAEAVAFGIGYHRTWLVVLKDNIGAMKLYEKLGYTIFEHPDHLRASFSYCKVLEEEL